jgi:hypothetical protein
MSTKGGVTDTEANKDNNAPQSMAPGLTTPQTPPPRAATPPPAQKKTKAPKNTQTVPPQHTSQVVATLQYSEGCFVEIDDKDMAYITWDNGSAILATRGAAMDYIEAHMFLHYHSGHYNFAADFAAMVAGKVDHRLAWIICLCRKVVFSLEEIEIASGEGVVAQLQNAPVNTGPAVTKMIKEHGAAINAIVQQSLTIFALNGESLISRGHHYDVADKFWERLVNSTKIDEHFATLGISNWEGPLFHDTMHPFDYDWMASQVADKESNLAQHINGVALKRLGVLPAGTTVLGLIAPLYNEISVQNSKLGTLLAPLVKKSKAEIEIIKKTPLDYCVSFRRAGVQEKVAKMQKWENPVVFMAAYLKKIGDKRSTILQARSLANMMQRCPQAAALGDKSAAAFAPDALDETTLLVKITAVLGADLLQ